MFDPILEYCLHSIHRTHYYGKTLMQGVLDRINDYDVIDNK